MDRSHDEPGVRHPDERYRALFNALDAGFCVVEVLFDEDDRPIDFRFLEVNAAFEGQTGLAQAVGQTMRELAPAKEEYWFQTFGQVAVTGKPTRFLNHAAALDRWYDVHAFRVGAPEDRQVGILFTDITEQRRTLEALRKNEEQLRVVLESATEYAIIVMDLDRRVTNWNTGAERLLGWVESEILGQIADVVFTTEDREAGAPQMEAGTALQKGLARNERWHVRKNGSRFWGSGLMFPLRDDQERVTGLLKIFRDHTAERVAEERLQIAINVAQLGTWTYFPQTGEVQIDERTRELLNFPPGMNHPTYEQCINATHPDDRRRIEEHLQKVLRGETDGEYSAEYRTVNPSDHTERWLRAGGCVTFDVQRRPIRFVGTVLDISDLVNSRNFQARRGEELERLVAERTAELRESIQHLETVTYSVVHDMRAPLRSVRAFAEILSQDHRQSLQPAALDYLARMQRAVERMDALITDVLAYSRLGAAASELTPVDLNQLIHGIVEQYPQFQGCPGCIHIEPSLPKVRGNSALLTQCISNLIDNALKFVPREREPRLNIRAERSAPGRVTVWFEDNGLGIDPAYHERIFGLFERLHRTDEYPGTGVGLAIVRRAVERMQGRVGLESTPGRGSRFWIELPAAD